MEADKFKDQIARLKEEQTHALKDTDEQIQKWQSFKSDYQALKERLTTLPDQVKHDVMVPFGKMAFMPGKLVHTNEILVLLGDNWFAERSAKQAVGIVNRRIKQIDGQLEDLNKQRKLLEPRLNFTSDLQQLGSDGKDTYDIQEEYDEEREKQWKEEHKERVKNHRQKLKADVENNSRSSHDRSNKDEQLWARLDELEQIETAAKEMEQLGEEDSEETSQYPWKHREFSDDKLELDKDTELRDIDDELEKRFNKNNQEFIDSTGSSSELDSDDEESASERGDSGSDYSGSDYSGSKDSETIVTGGKVIHFTHTPYTPFSQENTIPGASMSQETVQHPGDVYRKFFVNPQPKSILKKTTSEPKKILKKKVRKRVVDFDTGSDTDEKSQIKPSVKQSPGTQAFTGMVLEKTISNTDQPPIKMATVVEKPIMNVLGHSSLIGAQTSKTTVTTKPVSRFKARRQNKSET